MPLTFTYRYRRAAVYVDKILNGAKPADYRCSRQRNLNLSLTLDGQTDWTDNSARVLERANEVIK